MVNHLLQFGADLSCFGRGRSSIDPKKEVTLFYVRQNNSNLNILFNIEDHLLTSLAGEQRKKEKKTTFKPNVIGVHKFSVSTHRLTFTFFFRRSVTCNSIVAHGCPVFG